MNDETSLREGEHTRRDILTGIGATVLSAGMQSTLGSMHAASAEADDSLSGSLEPSEKVAIDALCEVLLPGAGASGVARYMDNQLGRPLPLLFLRYMYYPISFSQFYKQGLRSLQRESLSRFGCRFEKGTPEQQKTLIQDISQSSPPGWSGPPAPLFYFVLRNDTVDVFYGTPTGFQKLGLPYAALLNPPSIL